jgi:cytochrome P450
MLAAATARRISRPTLAALPGRTRPDELVHLLRDPTGFLHARFERHGRVWKTRFVVPAVFAIGDEANRTLLVTRRDEFPQGQGYARTPVRWVFEGSIMLQDGDDHARTRALLTPAVGRLAIHDSAARVAAIWARHVGALAPERGEDVYAVAERATFEVAATALAGLPLGGDVDRFRRLFEDVIGGMMVPIPLRVPFGRLDRSLRARAALVRLLAPHVLAARAAPPVGLVGQLAHHRDDAGQPLPVEEVVQHIVLLAWAGYDTTASQASWILHTLAQRPDWQARLRDELAALSGEPAALESAARAPQLDAFLLEIERMYPSALFFPRVAVEDLELLDHRLPRGTLVFYSPYLTHRDPATFEHPNAFDPDRWLPARGERRVTPARLFGFGGGPRVCLGKAFAKLQLRLMVQALLARHHVEPDPQARPRIQGLPVHHPVGARIRVRPVDVRVAGSGAP